VPENFVVTLPKIVAPAQVAALADIYDLLEPRLNLPANTLKMEMMVETTQSLINERGK
jgi:malate synthase